MSDAYLITESFYHLYSSVHSLYPLCCKASMSVGGKDRYTCVTATGETKVIIYLRDG